MRTSCTACVPCSNDVFRTSPGEGERLPLVKRGFNLRVKAVLTPLNAPKVYEWVSLMAGLGVEKLSFAAYGSRKTRSGVRRSGARSAPNS